MKNKTSECRQPSELEALNISICECCPIPPAGSSERAIFELLVQRGWMTISAVGLMIRRKPDRRPWITPETYTCGMLRCRTHRQYSDQQLCDMVNGLMAVPSDEPELRQYLLRWGSAPLRKRRSARRAQS